MKSYSKIFCTAAVGLGLALTGCDNFLTPDNKSAVTDEDFFKTEKGFKSLVYDAYYLLNDKIFNSSNVCTYFNAGTDLYQDGRTLIDQGMHRWANFNPSASIPKEFYTRAYDGIRAAQQIKYYSKIAQVSDDVKNKAIDEGRFINAMYYYFLVNNFGGVPLVTEYASTAVKGYPRATAEQVYDYIITELTEVVSNGYLAASTATKGGGEASIEAAKALLAKTYLSAAWDLNKPEYFKQAAKLADEVIAGRELTTPFEKLWAADYSGDDNAEFIFDCEWEYTTAYDQTAGNRWQSFYSGYYGGAEEGMKNGSSNPCPQMYTLKLFEKGDKRYAATFMKELLVTKMWDINQNGFKENANPLGDYFGWYKNGNKSNGKLVAVYYPAWWETDEDIEAWVNEDKANRENAIIIPQDTKTAQMEPMITYYNDLAANGGKRVIRKYDFDESQIRSWAVNPCRKFDDANTAQYSAGRSFRDIHVITLPEMFFVAAEAYLKDNQGGKAAERINSVRARAGLAAKSSVTIDDILKEMACEMYGNGYRRMDLRRTQKLVEYNNLYNPHLKGVAASVIGEQLLWPIPQAAIDANASMTEADQNPGY